MITAKIDGAEKYGSEETHQQGNQIEDTVDRYYLHLFLLHHIPNLHRQGSETDLC